MRIPPLRSAVKMESDVSPDSSVTPGSVRGVTNANPIGEHNLVFPPNPRAFVLGTFRLILPEAIAIGVRFSHASCTGLDP